MAVQTFNDRSLDSAAFAAESVLPEENSFTILSSELMLKGEYMRDGDDLIIRGDLGEEIRVEEYFSGDNPPTLETPYGAIVLPETVQKLLVNSDSIEVAGPAGSLSIPGLLGDPIGTIDELGGEGQATAKGADGVLRTLNEGDPIYQDDVIETIGRSFANLRMVDDTSFQLGKETRAIIENYNYTPGVESGSFEATVISGFFRYASGKLGGLDKGTHTTIKTPTAQIGVRGSEMEGIVEEDGSSTFVHKDGILDVSDANGRGTVTLDEPGMATAVSSKPGAPAAAYEAPESLLASFEEALPPSPDFVVSHDEEEAEGEGELLDVMVAVGEEAAEEEEGGEAAEELAPVLEAVAEEEEVVEVEVAQDAIPVASNDLVFGLEDGGSTVQGEVLPITGNLAGNDQKGDGKHTWFKASDPEHGTLVVNPDGSFVYTPNPHYNGIDRFTYTLRDADGDESTAQVVIDLAEVNDAPVMVVDSVLVFREGDVTVQGSAVVSDVDNTGDQVIGGTVVINNALANDVLSYEAPEGSKINTTFLNEGGVATLTFTGVASYEEYQQALSSVRFESKGGEDPTQNGQTPTRSITWQFFENDGSAEGLASQPVTVEEVNITPVNNPPAINGDLPVDPIPYANDPNGSEALFPQVAIDPIEDWQSIQQLVFSVSGITPGDVHEMLLMGDPAEEIPLVFTQGATTQLSDGTTVTYEERGEALVLTVSGDWDTAAAANLLSTVKYKNTNPDPVEGNRDIKLESIVDSGGVEHGGVDALNVEGVAATVAVLLPPSLNVVSGVVPDSVNYAEFPGGIADETAEIYRAVDLFPESQVQFDVGGLDGGKQHVNQLVVKITDIAPDDRLVIDGAAIDITTDDATGSMVAVPDGLPAYQYTVEVIGSDAFVTLSSVVSQGGLETGVWEEVDVTNLISALKFTNVGDDPDVSGANPIRTVSLHAMQDDGSTVDTSTDDAFGLLGGGLSTTVNVEGINDAPSYTSDVLPNVTFVGGTVLSGLFPSERGNITPVESSQKVTEIVLTITNVSGENTEALYFGNQTDGFGSFALIDNSGQLQATATLPAFDYQVSLQHGATKTATVTLSLPSDSSGDLSNLLEQLGYYNAAEGLDASRKISVESVKDSAGGVSDPNLTLEITVQTPANVAPSLVLDDSSSAYDPAFREHQTLEGGGAYEAVFYDDIEQIGMVFNSSAGLGEDSRDRIGFMTLKVENVAAGDWVQIGGAEINLTSPDATAGYMGDAGTFNYHVVYSSQSDTATIYLRAPLQDHDADSSTAKVFGWESDYSDPDHPVDQVNELLQSLAFKNDGIDPVPMGTEPSRIFTVTEIQDTGGNLVENIVDDGEVAALQDSSSAWAITKTVSIDPYNQSPILGAGPLEGGVTDPARYTQSGLEKMLFTVGTVGASAVEASQHITSLTFTVTWIGGIPSGQDGSKEWIRIGGVRDEATGKWAGGVPITLDIGSDGGDILLDGQAVAVTGSVVALAGDAAGREVTLDFGQGLSMAEVNQLVEGMAFGLEYNADGIIQGSGVRTITLTEIQDDGGVEVGMTNDTADDLNVVAAVEVMVDADGGATIVNKNVDFTGGALVSDEEKSSQYFQYDESNGALLSEASAFTVTVRLDAEVIADVFEGIYNFEIFNYAVPTSTLSSAVTLASELGKLQVQYDAAIAGDTSSWVTKGTLVDGDGNWLTSTSFLDGHIYELKLEYDGASVVTDESGNIEGNGTEPEVEGKFTLTLADVSSVQVGEFSYAQSEIAIDSIGTSNFLESQGTIQFGNPGFTGTIYDIAVEAGSNKAHWEMDRIDSVNGSEVIADSLGTTAYALSVVDTSLNDENLEVDTLLVKEAIDIGELEYLLTNKQFTSDPSQPADNVSNLQIDLTDGASQLQTLVASDVLNLGLNTVEVFGDSTDTLTLSGWTQDTSDATRYTYSSGGNIVELFVEQELNANVTMS